MFRLALVAALIAGLYFLFTRRGGGNQAEGKEPGDDAR
jgi:hypothetical protein